MSVPELVAFFERYAASFAAPVLTETAVQRVERLGRRLPRGDRSRRLVGRSVVVATGYCDCRPVPALAAGWRRRHRADRAGGLPDGPEQLPHGRRARRRRFVDRRAARRRDAAPGGRSRWRSAVTRGCRGAIAGATSSGGSTGMGVLDESADQVQDAGGLARQPSLQLDRPGRPRAARSGDAAGARACGWRAGALGGDGGVTLRRRSRGHHGAPPTPSCASLLIASTRSQPRAGWLDARAATTFARGWPIRCG